ncbi:MAG: hypothetical protein P4L50_01785 [Anaerolineaceae bacterium]|nr:DNA-binding protein [Alphaproteobacteria bacterium]MDR3572568.1 hypothetical protein [Anaerolineaceae bacterium]
MPEPVAYLIPDFCRIYAISRTSFYREIKAKRLRLFKRGKRSLVERVEAERWYARLTGRPPQEGGKTQT